MSAAGVPIYLGDASGARVILERLRAAGLRTAAHAAPDSFPGLGELDAVRVAAAEIGPARLELAQHFAESSEGLPRFGDVDPQLTYRLRPSAYALLRDEAGRIAIARQPLGDFLVGGGIEGDESPPEAIEREGVEEVGLRLAATDFLGVADEFLLSPKYGEPFQKRCVFYRAEVVGEGVAVEEDHELVWAEPAELLRSLYHLAHRWAVTLDEAQRRGA